MRTVMLLVASNIFMTFAWYRHLRHQAGSPLWSAVLVSWGIAFFEYCLAVPANRIGYGRFTLAELKVTQEIISLVVFGVFSAFWMRERVTLNHLWAACCLVGAAFFVFRR
ncbi:MAG: DMT family protein [Myxococcales bacterium]|nr:DMT family protein [Myxococcales bacterium]MBL0197200.1 DMT family protein [Myxococcales bacterium]HQY63723.1 DMT family protein [Polyangiaceae bacterium]